MFQRTPAAPDLQSCSATLPTLLDIYDFDASRLRSSGQYFSFHAPPPACKALLT